VTLVSCDSAEQRIMHKYLLRVGLDYDPQRHITVVEHRDGQKFQCSVQQKLW